MAINHMVQGREKGSEGFEKNLTYFTRLSEGFEKNLTYLIGLSKSFEKNLTHFTGPSGIKTH